MSNKEAALLPIRNVANKGSKHYIASRRSPAGQAKTPFIVDRGNEEGFAKFEVSFRVDRLFFQRGVWGYPGLYVFLIIVPWGKTV